MTNAGNSMFLLCVVPCVTENWLQDSRASEASVEEMLKGPPGPKICSAESCIEVLVQVSAQVLHCACLCALPLGLDHMGKPARPSHPVPGCCF